MTEVQFDQTQEESKIQHRQEDEKEELWCEIRMQGKLPERRSNHIAFIWVNQGQEYMYIHGGRDLKEGNHSSMWRVNCTALQQLHQGVQKTFQWESIASTGKDLGKISHHSCSMVSSKEVAVFGGLQGENSNNNIALLNLQNNTWSQLATKTSIECLGRDDFAIADIRDGSFYTFGGYVNGSRVDDIVKLKHEGAAVTAEQLAGEAVQVCGPSKRASVSVGVHDQKMYVFGGQENDNKKLNDLWQFDLQTCQWSQVDQSTSDYKPTPRSGHSTIVYGEKMYIFGGILELTKELNDLVVFNFETRQFTSSSDNQEDDLNATQAHAAEMSSPDTKQNTLQRKRTMATNSMTRSPTKKQDSMLPKGLHASTKKDATSDEAKPRLTSPTSVSMKNTFIIKNADDSFEVNSKLLPKNKQRLTETQTVKYTDLVEGNRPPPRDGHSAVVDSQGYMFIFGGDRHHMPFNDLYMIKLE